MLTFLSVVHIDFKNLADDKQKDMYWFFAVSTALETWDLRFLNVYIMSSELFEPRSSLYAVSLIH